jgi:hypothetical protein
MILLDNYCHVVYVTAMKRTNIYLSDSQHAALAKLSKQTLAPVAALIRKAIDESLARQKK